MAKNSLLFELSANALQDTLDVLKTAEIKQSDLPQVVTFLLNQSNKLVVPDGKVVHWSPAQLEILTAYITDLTRNVLLMGKEVNRMRVGQRRPIKNFIKEAQLMDEYEELHRKRKEAQDAYKGTEK